jgi:hypothetical protein
LANEKNHDLREIRERDDLIKEKDKQIYDLKIR